MRDLDRRLSRLEGLLGPSECTIIRIFGGVPSTDRHASAGSMRFYREPFESDARFEDRVIEAATEAGETLVVFDGLPDMPEDDYLR